MFRAPTQTPPFSVLLDDLPTRCSRQISRLLGISPATLARWRRHENAPRLAYLVLFWETRWGLSVLDAEIENYRRVSQGLIGALERDNAALRAQIEALAAQGSPGASNDPLWSVNCERAKRPSTMARPLPGQPSQLQPLPLLVM